MMKSVIILRRRKHSMTKKLSLFQAIVFVLASCLTGAFAAETPEFGKF